MKYLVIGGTRFVGRHIVEELFRNGHEVTLFHRGNSQNLFPGIHEIIGDRDTELHKIENFSADWVIDTCGYYPLQVKQSAELLAKTIPNYLFISTCSVYERTRIFPVTEESSLVSLPADYEKDTREMNSYTYGPLKVFCEEELLKIYPDNSVILRPVIITGAFDSSFRFPYWVWKNLLNKPFIVPGPSENRVFQTVDVQDIAEISEKLTRNFQMGIFNLSGKCPSLTMNEFISDLASETHSNSTPIWVEPDILKKQKISMQDIPLWIEDHPDKNMYKNISSGKILQLGFKFRGFPESIQSVKKWIISSGINQENFSAFLSLEQEENLIRNFLS